MPEVPEASNPLLLLPPPYCSSPIPRPFRKGHPLRRAHLLFLFLPLVIVFNLSVTSSTSYHILLLFLISTAVRLFISIPDFYRYPGERNADEAPYFRALDLLRPNCSGLFTVGRTWRTGFVSFSGCFSLCNLISLQKIPSNRGKLGRPDLGFDPVTVPFQKSGSFRFARAYVSIKTRSQGFAESFLIQGVRSRGFQ